MSSTSPAGRQAGRMSSRRAGHGRAPLAAVPDPAEQAALAAAGEARARAGLKKAVDAGEPLVDPSGSARSPITLPEYRQGRAPANKGRRYPIEVLSSEEVMALMAAMPRSPTGTRNRALVAVLWRGGLRIAEALALFPKDVDLATGAVVVLLGKGSKRRVAVMDPGALGFVAEWLRLRAQLGLGDDVPLFCTVTNDAGGRGRPLGAASVRETLKLYARKARIAKRVHPHGLRHTHAFELSLEDVPVAVIRAQLGHRSLEMTQRYVDHLAPKHLLERLSARTWPGKPPRPAGAARSQGHPGPSASERIPRRVVAGDPPEPRPAPSQRGPAPPGQGAQRVLEAIAANGGTATQGQLRRALGLSAPTLLVHLHALHAAGRALRAGMDRRNRSIIWKVAPPPQRVHPVLTRPRRAPSGQGPARVLDALKALGGRASQARLAATLGVTPNTVHSHCLALEAQGQIQRGDLDKSTSRRGSQVWCVRRPGARWEAAGYGLRLQLTHDDRSTSTTI